MGIPTAFDYRAALAEFERREVLGLMAVMKHEGRWDLSHMLFRDGRLVRHDKAHATPDMEHIGYGVALLRRDALDPRVW